MKALVTLMLIAGLAQSVPLTARAAGSAYLLGSWALDTSRMSLAPEARPKSVTISFSDAGGKWTTHVDIVSADGAESHALGTGALDGAPVAVQGSPEADVAAFKMPAPNVLIMSLSKGGIPGSTRIYSVEPDGKHLVETSAYFGDQGMPVLKTYYFSRVR
jgi:hypothetical protein